MTERQRVKDAPLSSKVLGQVGDESLERTKHSSVNL